MQIVRGKIDRAKRVVIYGPEGVGKSTLASMFPSPVFIDVEGGTEELDVARIPVPGSFMMIKQLIAEFRRDQQGFRTLVIDTADWAERLLITEVCAQNNLSALGGQDDFGRSYNLLETAWAKFLDSLTDISETCGVHIVILAHAQMRKFEQPEEAGAFDRWELKLQKKTSALLKEWPGLLLFASYHTMVVEVKKTKKGQGGQRVLRTTHHPCWDAKNRHGLPEEMPMDYAHIAHIFQAAPTSATTTSHPPPSLEPPTPTLPPAKEVHGQPHTTQSLQIAVTPLPVPTSRVPTKLEQLMKSAGVDESDLRRVVATRGYYPPETPISNYAPDFVEGVLVAAWDKVLAKINEMRGGQAQ